MSDSFIQLPPDSTGKLLRTFQLTVGANSTQQEAVTIGDPVTAANLLTVDSSGRITVLLSDGTNVIGTSAHPVRIDPTGTTIQPVSGTVTITDPANGATGAAVPATAVYVAGNKSGNLTGLLLDASGFLEVNLAANSFGTLTVTGTVSITANSSVNVNQVGGASFALGQQLAAASLPVVLTAAQITTLTPLATVAVTQSTSPWIVAGGGTAGTAASGVVTVQGIAGGTTLPVTATIAAAQTIAVTNTGTFAVQEATLDAALIAQEATTSGVKGLTTFGAVTTNAPTYTTAKSDALSLDTSGLLRVSVKDTPSNTNNLNVNLAASAATVTVTGTVSATQGTSPWVVSTQTATSGGTVDFHLVSAGSTNANNVKASAGQLYGWRIYNNAGYPVYVKFYNTAGTPTPGTGVVETVGVQAGTAAEFSIGAGIAYSTGIGLSITKGITDADATAVLASDCVVDIFYK